MDKKPKNYRKLRQWYPNATYHITSRGNRKNVIFKEDEDYIVYIRILYEALKYFENQYEIMSYCLMTNHVHLQVRTNEKHIKELMMRINSFYAKYFNNKYRYVGHLFQSRYRSELITEERYLLEVSRYIHLNPVKAKIVKRPEDYEWSSYCMYIGMEKEKIINKHIILSHFQDNEFYRKYVEDKLSLICESRVQ